MQPRYFCTKKLIYDSYESSSNNNKINNKLNIFIDLNARHDSSLSQGIIDPATINTIFVCIVSLHTHT